MEEKRKEGERMNDGEEDRGERGRMTEKRMEGREDEWRRRGWRGERINEGEEDGGERG